MNPEDAIQLLDDLVGKVPLVREDAQKVAVAVSTIKGALSKAETPEPEAPSE